MIQQFHIWVFILLLDDVWVCTGEDSPIVVLRFLLSPSPTKAPHFPSSRTCSLGCGTLLPSPLTHHSLAPQAVSTEATLVLSRELTSRAWVSVARLPANVSGCDVLGRWSAALFLCFALLSPTASLFSGLGGSLSILADLRQLGGLRRCGFLSSFTALECWSGPDSFFFFFFSFSFSFCST